MIRLPLTLFVLFNLITLIFPLKADRRASSSSVSPSLDNPDFIVIGAGTSGCTLTTRLCEALPNARIVLIERSSPRNEKSELNVRAARNVFDAWIDSNISSHLLTQSAHSGVPSIAISANTYGGASAINAGQFTMPPNGTFPNVYRISGLSNEKALQLLHQRVFPKVKPTAISDEESNSWIDAAQTIGVKKIDNPLLHGHNDDDASFVSVTSFDQNGRRRDSCTSYKPRQICGSRLKILESSRVDTLIFDKNSKHNVNKVIRGVKLNTMKEIFARHEVLITAGAYESPKLLQLSGIGPRNVLQDAGIQVKHPLPVGTYAQSRAATAVLSTYEGKLSQNNDGNLHTTMELISSRASFLSGQGGGILSRRIGCANGRLKGLGEVTMVTGFPLSDKFPGKPFFNRKLIRSTCVLNTRHNVYSPISITSNNSSVPPHIEFNSLKSTHDRNRMIQCIEKLRNLHERIPNTAMELLPGKGKDLETYVKEYSQNGQHYVGGCAVGKVVDRKDFKIIGLKGVRVIDASVIPVMPVGAGPMASVYIVAEHAAEIIIRDYQSIL